jgi:Ca2+-binding RTX toxin-like protein
MATVTALQGDGSIYALPVPFAALPAATPVAGSAGALSLRLAVTGGSDVIEIIGTGFTYDGGLLPASGIVTDIAWLRAGAALWRAEGFAVTAQEFRAQAGQLDTLLFGGADTVIGRSENGPIGRDWLMGHGGDDSILGGGGPDFIDAGPGSDTVRPGLNLDAIQLGDGDDLALMGDAANFGLKIADGGGGSDTLVGGGDLGASTILGFEALAWDRAATRITIRDIALAGFDTLSIDIDPARAETVRLAVTMPDGFVDLGDHAILGGAGDRLEVSLLSLGVGGVVLGRDSGDGAADDVLDIQATGFLVASFGGADRLGSAGRGTAWTGAGADSVAFDGASLLILDAGNDTALGGAEADTIDGGTGRDSLLGGDGGDVLVGAGDNDTIDGGLGTDWIWGGAGDDSIDGGASGLLITRDSVHGGEGDDRIRIGTGTSTGHATGDAGADTITSGGFASTLEGGAGGDVLTGSGTGIRVGMFTSFAIDVIDGGEGNDLITGLRGSDRMTGGTGADTFAYAAEDGGVVSGSGGSLPAHLDVITDFNRAEGDRIDLSGLDADTGMPGEQPFVDLLPIADDGPRRAGSLRYQLGEGFTTVFGSTDGDFIFEWQVAIAADGFVPQIGDFIL